MNKQELIKEYESIVKDDSLELCGCYNMADKNFMRKIYKSVLEDLEQLDEPQKVTVPQFVADWYEEYKDDFEGELFRCVDLITRDFEDGDLSEFEEWFIDGKTKPFQTLVNMHQFGYEVEKEKRYYVRLKGVDENYNYFNCIKHLNAWCLTELKTDKKFRMTHTRKQLEDADFGWVFDCEGIELEEVTE